MAEIKFNAFSQFLDEANKKSSLAPVYLFHGDEYLYKKKLEDLLNAIVPGKKRKYQYESVDGIDGSVFDVIERLNTYSLLSGTKVVSLTDARIFHSKKDKAKILEGAKDKSVQEDFKAASKKFLNFLSVSGFDFEDIETAANREKAFTLTELELSEGVWIDQLISYCLENNLKIPAYTDDSTALKTAIEKGFPKKHHLIITTDLIDKRRVLYKTINTSGVIIDCSVPSGNRKADTDQKNQVFSQVINEILSKSGKRIEPAAINEIIKLTGFELRIVTGNIEKLVNYIGNKDKITLNDVTSVLKRTKKDPIYELTEAVSNKDLGGALFYLHSLLGGGEYFPLQIMAALVNQLRKLLIAKDFTKSAHGRNWGPGVQFNQFKTAIIRDVVAYDTHQDEETRIQEDNESRHKGGGKKKGVKTGSDLSLVKNPNNAYPVFQLLKKSDKFTKSHLEDSYEKLYEADHRLKSTDLAPQLILENLIIHICR